MAKTARRPGAKEVRLTGGVFRGRRLRGAPGIRPTPAMVREALFSILGEDIRGVRVLDLYAGTGAVALEALGRGAESAVLVDCSRASLQALRANIEALGLAERARVAAGEACALLSSGRFSQGEFGFVFLGPPYDRDFCRPTLERIAPDIFAPGQPIVVVQASPREALPDAVGCLVRSRLKTYGDCLLHFYALAPQPS